MSESDETHEARLAKALSETSRSSAVIEVVRGGYVAPLKKLTSAVGSNLGSFDGGAYGVDGRVCTRALHIKNGFRNIPVPISTGAAPLIDGRHLFGGILKNEHFGHFFAESLARLWALEYLDGNVKSVVFYLRAESLAIPRFATQTLEILCPGASIHIVRQLTQFETLIVPEQIAHPSIGFIYGHPVVREMCAKLRRLSGGDGPKKVYVSRSKLTHSEGAVVSETFLERNLQANGYAVIHPQLMSIPEQISVYSSADQLIFAEGSALHLYALVARPDQQVYVLRRRSMSVVFDWQIRTFGPVVYGTPCISRLYIPEKDHGSMLRAKAVLDFDLLRSQLCTLGFLDRQAKWAEPTEAVVASELDEIETTLRCRLVQYEGQL